MHIIRVLNVFFNLRLQRVRAILRDQPIKIELEKNQNWLELDEGFVNSKITHVLRVLEKAVPFSELYSHDHDEYNDLLHESIVNLAQEIADDDEMQKKQPADKLTALIEAAKRNFQDSIKTANEEFRNTLGNPRPHA